MQRGRVRGRRRGGPAGTGAGAGRLGVERRGDGEGQRRVRRERAEREDGLRLRHSRRRRCVGAWCPGGFWGVCLCCAPVRVCLTAREKCEIEAVLYFEVKWKA